MKSNFLTPKQFFGQLFFKVAAIVLIVASVGIPIFMEIDRIKIKPLIIISLFTMFLIGIFLLIKTKDKNQKDKSHYQELFDYLHTHCNFIALQSDMQDIEKIVKRMLLTEGAKGIENPIFNQDFLKILYFEQKVDVNEYAKWQTSGDFQQRQKYQVALQLIQNPDFINAIEFFLYNQHSEPKVKARIFIYDNAKAQAEMKKKIKK